MNKDALVKNSESKSQIKQAKKKEKLQNLYSVEYMRQELSTYAGRMVLYEIIGLGGLYREHLMKDSNATAYRCGQSSVSKKVIEMICEADEKAYAKLLLEKLDYKKQSMDT